MVALSLGMPEVAGSFPGLAIRVDSEDHYTQVSDEWCIHPGLKPMGKTLKSKTESIGGSTKW